MTEVWTVYDSPVDRVDTPGRYVARKWRRRQDQPRSGVLQDNTLAGIRAQLPRGLVRLARSPHDDPRIVEIWI
jgi:hypothetical protein